MLKPYEITEEYQIHAREVDIQEIEPLKSLREAFMDGITIERDGGSYFITAITDGYEMPYYLCSVTYERVG